MEHELPYNDYYEYYAPDYELDVKPSNMDNANSRDYLEKIQIQVIENLKSTTTHAPSVQMTEVPRDSIGINDDDDAALDDLDEDNNPDQRKTKRQWDKYVEREDELSASEDEEEGERNGVRRQPGREKRRRALLDYRNPSAMADDDEAVDDTASLSQAQNGIGENAKDAGSADDEDEDMEQSATDVGDDSEAEDGVPANGAEEEDEDGDLEMGDDEPQNTTANDPDTSNSTLGTVQAQPSQPPALPGVTATERQEATPPDSPVRELAAPVAAGTQVATDGGVVGEAMDGDVAAVSGMGNDAMDEGDTIDAEEEKEEGRRERESEDVKGEERAERSETA
ncbi:MAG: hypothetical protein Q9183_006276 [Haloplaca sp. 2 TL-2023]